jgi:hypothetical protein
MAYSQADIDALKAAIATGARRVKFGSGPDSREVEYRTLAEMRGTLADMVDEAATARFSPVTFAEHTRD